MVSYVTRVLAVLPPIEFGRRLLGPARIVKMARRWGVGRSSQTIEERQELRRAIAAIDRRMPGGGNCYRRVLLEIALDGSAANEPVYFGINSGGGVGSGHAWLASEKPGADYDAVFSL